MHQFLALPLVAKITTYGLLTGTLVIAWIKREAIGQMRRAATNAAQRWLFGSLGKKLNQFAQSPLNPNEHTYRGTLIDFAKQPNRKSYYFEIEALDGLIHKVAVTDWTMFHGVPLRSYVEIDTKSGDYIGEEVVLRVRQKTRLS